jgi:GGDEF domain-containing protein
MTALERLRIGDAVLLLDLDGFKEVNDRHGRAAGDAVLADLGRLLRASMRGIDAVARCGGEEFLVVISQAPSAAREITDRLLADWRAGAPCSTLCGCLAGTRPAPLDTAPTAPLLTPATSATHGQNKVEAVAKGTLVDRTG